MKRNVAFFVVLCLFSAAHVFAQNAPKKPSSAKLPIIEPFSIAPGKSFSASPSGTKTAVGQANLATAITDDFAEALQIIKSNHIDGKKIRPEQLAKRSISTMLKTLDPHSNYFDAEQYEELLTDQQSEYFGIGATIVNYEKNGTVDTYIIATYPDSSASRAHLRYGDKILAVNGEKVSGQDSAIVRDKVRGKIGSVVRLTLERADTKNVEVVEVKRNRVPQPSVPDAYLLRPGVGYVDLSSGFNYTTSSELNAALKQLHQQGANSLILDLRDNPGGILEQAVKVAEKFLPAGNTIVSQRGRFRLDNRTWTSTNQSAETLPLVVLVNENSASASEIVAGALQDYDRAMIIGEKTFGKGLVQSVINLPLGSGLTLTTARYFTPSGRSIQRAYENSNLYDYFNHKANFSESDKNKLAATTVTGRKVYGGDGILPDETISNPEITALQSALLDPIFFFSSELAAGRVKNLEQYKTAAARNIAGQRIRSSDYPITDDIFERFKDFVQQNFAKKSVSAAKIDQNRAFIKIRLRYNLIMAAYGSVAANQVLIEDDLQVAKAAEILPRAQQLAQAAKKYHRK